MKFPIKLSSNRNAYEVVLTPTELRADMSLFKNSSYYTVYIADFPPIEAIYSRYGSVRIPTVRTLFYNNKSFKNKPVVVKTNYMIFLDQKGLLHIGCREFNKDATKAILKWIEKYQQDNQQ